MPLTRVKLTAPRYRRRHSVGLMLINPQRSRYIGLLSRSHHSASVEMDIE